MLKGKAGSHLLTRQRVSIKRVVEVIIDLVKSKPPAAISSLHFPPFEIVEHRSKVQSESGQTTEMDGDNLRVKKEEKEVNDDTNPLNVPDEDGDFPLLLAIGDGEDFDCIQKMLNNGANVNVKSKDESEDTAAHEVVYSLMDKARTPDEAIAILNLLIARGFSLINEKNSDGRTPLHLAMEIHDLSEDILTWFYRNGADFNAAEPEYGDSVLAEAIDDRQRGTIIRKIVDFGADPARVDKFKRSALHVAAANAHESAMEFFLDVLDANGQDAENETPLHFLFENAELDYQHCLRMLLRKGANFGAKNGEGYVPMVNWLKYVEGNPFPTFMKTIDDLSPFITQEIASAVLTVIVEKMETFRAFLPCSSCHAPSETMEFIKFLIEEKKAKLELKDEDKWKRENWIHLSKVFLNGDFLRELEKASPISLKGQLILAHGTNLGKIDFYTKSSTFPAPIETVILCLLSCKKYQAFVEVCRVVGKFCKSA